MMSPCEPGKCRCCPRKCGVNRLKKETGFCGIDARTVVSHCGLHFGEEPPISGSRGSGTVFFAGCNLRCVFCQNWQISQEFDSAPVNVFTTDQLAAELLRLQAAGAHNINFVSPSHMIFQMADAVTAARDAGLTVPIVYNSNGYDSVSALRRIAGLVDIYLPDLKYMDPVIAERYSAAPDYPDVVPGVLDEMYAQCGELISDENGAARRGLLVRHLVLPGQLDNSRRCLELLQSLDPAIHISLMSQYSPRYRAAAFPEIDRTLTKSEYDEIVSCALDAGFENLFLQDMSSREAYLPDFRQNEPFNHH